MINSRRCRIGIKIGLAALVCATITLDQRKAEAIAPGIIFTKVAEGVQAIQTYYSTIDWVNCHFGNLCPKTDVQQAADRVISELGALYARYDTSMNLAAFQALVDRVHRDFDDPTALTQAEENDLLNQMEWWFEQFSSKLNGFSPTSQTEVEEAYILAPVFNIMASMLDLLARTELVSNHVPMTVAQLNDYRARTLATNEALVGSLATWGTCGGGVPTMLSTVDSFDHLFPTRKLWKAFADYEFWINTCGNAYRCVPFRQTTGDNICQADCTQNFLHICRACVGPRNQDVYRQEYPKILAKMDRDPVVITVRTAMEKLVGAAASHSSGVLWRQFSGELDLWNVWSDTSYKSSALGSADTFVWQPIGTGDFDADGYGDVLWIDKRDGLLSIWELAENKVKAMTPGTANAPNLDNLAAYVGDLDADGVADIVWTGTTTILKDPRRPTTVSVTITWMMNAGSTIPRSATTVNSKIQVVGLGDFERATSAATAPYRVQKILRGPDGTVSLDDGSGSGVTLDTVPSDWAIKGTGDFNGDRSDDILWYNANTGEVVIWGMQAYQRTWTVSTGWWVPASSGWTLQGVADVDHDGIADIIWQHSSGAASIWMMNSGGTPRAGTWIAATPGAAITKFAGVIALGPQLPQNPQAPWVSTNCGDGAGRLRNPGFNGYETWWGDTFFGAYGTMLGDVDGDGKGDLVAVGAGYVGLLRSQGTQFGAYETAYANWFVGNHGNLLGDVTGDGKADLLELVDDGIWMLTGTGGSPTFSGPSGVWNNTFDGGLGITLIGDVTGDGKADLLTVGNGYVAVLRSQGNSFAYETALSTTFSGGCGTFLADVDGDGAADLVAVGSSGVTVRRATGAAAGNPIFIGYDEIWYSGYFCGAHGTLLSDVDGNGRADLIALDDGQVRVMRANAGGGFASPEIWSTDTFYGSHATLAGDVDGNGKADLIGAADGYVAGLRSQ